jgi:hypothetical protein
MLRALCERQDELAVAVGAISADPFLFSLTADTSLPMPPGYVTKRGATLKSHLGIEEKRAGTVELEDEALRLFREHRQPRRAGMTGPAPAGAHSYAEIGRRLDRSEQWAVMAIAAAVRRESAAAHGGGLDFDGSILALRKFTSSELLDAGCEETVTMVSMLAWIPNRSEDTPIRGRKSAMRKRRQETPRWQRLVGLATVLNPRPCGDQHSRTQPGPAVLTNAY